MNKKWWDMKESKKYLFLVAIISVALTGLLGCGDGSYARRPTWSLGGQNGGASPDIVVPTIECVRLINYEGFDFEVEGDITRTEGAEDSMEAASAMSEMMGGKSWYNDPPELTCIEDEIGELESSGREYNWGSRTFLLFRDRTAKRPKKDSVVFIEYTNCEQVRNASCLYVN